MGVDGEEAAVTVAEEEGEGGHGEECLSEPGLWEAAVIHERASSSRRRPGEQEG